MVLLVASVVLTVVALVRNPSAWRPVIAGWAALIAVSLIVVVPLHMRAQEELREGMLSGAMLQNFGPLGGALGHGLAEVGVYRAKRLMSTANAVDVASSLALIVLLTVVIARSGRGDGAGATSTPLVPATAKEELVTPRSESETRDTWVKPDQRFHGQRF